jgi:hypothetical protein
MVKTATRFILLRLLPGRIFLLLTIWDAWRVIRDVRRRIAESGTVQVNDPTASRTAPPTSGRRR